MNESDLNALVIDWLKYFEVKSDDFEDSPLWWAVERVMRMPSADAPGLWEFIREAYPREMSEFAFANLAAGPLENLLSKHGAEYIAEVEQLAAKDERFKHLLGGVWQLTMTDEVWQRVRAARGEAVW